MTSTDPKCILVVDDDDHIREAVAQILQFGGYRVELATGGEQALTKMRSTRPDAIVLDLMMPVMDGWAFLQHCRVDPLFVITPVLLLSASPKGPATASEYHQVQGWLTKPFDLNELLDMVEGLLH